MKTRSPVSFRPFALAGVLAMLLAGAGRLPASTPSIAAETVWVDELNLATVEQEGGAPVKKLSLGGQPLAIAGRTFVRGFSTHAESWFALRLDGQGRTFSAQVGVDDEVKGKPGNWNDPDMLILGYIGWGNPKPTRLTPDEQYLHFSLWCLFSAPLLIGCDMEKLDDFTLGLLTNDEVIALDQDPLGQQARCVDTAGDVRVYTKKLEDGSVAVGFCNFGAQPAELKYTNLAGLGLAGRQQVRDLWHQQEVGTVTVGHEPWPITIPTHGIVLLKFTAQPAPAS